jgi:membrane associated rhomboid family serine protease
MIPIKDDNPTRTFPFFTLVLIAANVFVYFYQLFEGDLIIWRLGLIPDRLFHPGSYPKDVLIRSGSYLRLPNAAIPEYLTVLTSMFIHGGFFHLAGNMLYLWIFGNNIEDDFGHIRFLLFYIFCGAFASLFHAVLSFASGIPMVGASGAISGVLGAYMVRFPGARVHVVIWFFFLLRIIPVPALVVLGLWFLMQLLSGASSLGIEGGGVAWFAHIGGFLIGAFLMSQVKKRRKARIKIM